LLTITGTAYGLISKNGLEPGENGLHGTTALSKLDPAWRRIRELHARLIAP
jgi:hypothetical protein